MELSENGLSVVIALAEKITAAGGGCCPVMTVYDEHDERLSRDKEELEEVTD
jgi:hypothetical protein